jgi:hypothetical protein
MKAFFGRDGLFPSSLPAFYWVRPRSLPAAEAVQRTERKSSIGFPVQKQFWQLGQKRAARFMGWTTNKLNILVLVY